MTLDELALVGIGLVLVLHLTMRGYLIARYGWVGSDTYYHFTLAELVRTSGIRGLTNDRFLRPENVDYPPLIPSLVARLPAGSARSLQYLAPIADTLTLAAVAGAGACWFGPVAGLLAALTYSSTPQTFDIAYSFGPRAVANLFLTLFLLTLASGAAPQAAVIALAAVLAALVLLTQRLSAQTLAVCLTMYGITRDPLSALACGTGALALAIVASKGYYLVSLRGHLSFLTALARQLLKSSQGGLRGVLHSGLARSVRLVRGNPHLAIVPLIWASGGSSSTLGLLETWILAIGALSIAWPLGEGERHFTGGAAIVALMVGALAPDHP